MEHLHDIARLQPEFNTNGKIEEKLELEYFDLIKSPVWKRLYANSNYGYRYEKVYTNFEKENPHLIEPNRRYVFQMAEILNRFKEELKGNFKILDDIELLRKRCPTYVSLIDISDLELLKQCMVQKVMHIDFYNSICNERFSDTDYDLICLDCSILKYIKCQSLREVEIDNSFGNTTIYFDEAVLDNGMAKVDVDNSFGSVKLYIPSDWKVSLRVDESFGHVKTFGRSAEESSNCLNVFVDTSFGDVEIHYI